ncbi:MAG: tRNA epoxyqueuosine(34) reductase QueG [Bdellovibrionales bacterium]|nr:tRNA epoxyqueuosine(34) reductase QueG [Bdellovibrionales bacterium]
MAGAGLLNPDLHSQLQAAARSEGFLEAAGVDISKAWTDYQEHFRKFEDWIGRGNAGEMHYLVRGQDRRRDPKLVFSEAQSVFCVLLPYRKLPAGQTDPSKGPRYARYLDGEDYHERVSAKLETALKKVAQQNPQVPLRWKVCVDTSAVLERSWAALSGLGWIGKNTLLIHPKHGSYTFIGVVLLNQELGQSPRSLPDYCGNCSRCLHSCPTQALEQSRSLNSRKCISYWTLEKRGELTLSDEDQAAMGTWVAGCDLCQEACPFNTKPVRASLEGAVQSLSGAITTDSWEALMLEDENQYRDRVAQSALSRVKPEMFKRNLMIARKNAPQTKNFGDE